MNRVVIDKFGGLDTSGDPYSTTGSTDLSNVDINNQFDIVKAKGVTLITDVSQYDIISIQKTASPATTTKVYTENDLTSKLSAGNSVIIAGLTVDGFGQELNNKSFHVTSVTAQYVEIDVDSSAFVFPTKSITYTLSTGYQGIACDFDSVISAADLLIMVNTGSATISEVVYIDNAGAVVIHPATAFNILPNWGIVLKVDVAGTFTITGQRTYAEAYVFPTGYTGFSKINGSSYTAAKMMAEINAGGVKLDRLTKYSSGTWVVYLNTGIGTNFNITSADAVWAKFTTAYNWIPAKDVLYQYDTLSGAVDVTIAKLGSNFHSVGGLVI